MKIHATTRIQASDRDDCAFLNNALGYKELMTRITPDQKQADGSYLLKKSGQQDALGAILRRHGNDSLIHTYEEGDFICKVMEVEGRKITLKNNRYGKSGTVLVLE